VQLAMQNKTLFAILCVLCTLLVMPVAHTMTALLHEIQNSWVWAYTNIGIGLLGFIVIWLGLRKNEVQACVLGLIGGTLMFVGFFEFTFALFADVFNVPPLLNPETGTVLLTPGLQINEASFFLMLPVFLLFYANHQVRCNMIVWFRKTLRMDVGKPTEPSKGRSYARIVATETLFIIWMIYAISLITMDPRVLGPTHWLSGVIYVGFFIWPLYLNYRIIKIKVPGSILRYAIPTGILYWSWVEMLASMDVINEYYLHPLEYPLATTATIATAAILTTLIYQERFARAR
jgi:hypothetical protein